MKHTYTQQSVIDVLTKTIYHSNPNFVGVVQNPITEIYNGITTALASIAKLDYIGDAVYESDDDRTLLQIASLEIKHTGELCSNTVVNLFETSNDKFNDVKIYLKSQPK